MERQRILYIQEYLSHYTDEQKSASLKEIQNYLLTQAGLEKVSPLTIRRDIDSLILAGFNIQITRGLHNTFYYKMSNRSFTFNEIRFLVDSVSINKFLSAEQKQRLFQKFEGLCSQAEVRKLINRISISEVAPPSLNLLENLEKIHLILARQQKINFAYGKYNTEKHMVYYRKKRELIPCEVVYCKERFYLKCVNEETQKLRIYRIDRMKEIQAGAKFETRPELPKPAGAVLDIYEPERFEVVKLRVKRVLLDDMLEQLGHFVSVCPDSPESASSDFVVLRATIGISFGFYRWVLKYGSDVEILSPESIRNTYIQNLQSIMQLYEKQQLSPDTSDLQIK